MSDTVMCPVEPDPINARNFRARITILVWLGLLTAKPAEGHHGNRSEQGHGSARQEPTNIIQESKLPETNEELTVDGYEFPVDFCTRFHMRSGERKGEGGLG